MRPKSRQVLSQSEGVRLNFLNILYCKTVVNKLPKVVGPWMVDVQQVGRYRMTQRQYPKVAGKPVVAKHAKIEIAGKTMEQPVEPTPDYLRFISSDLFTSNLENIYHEQKLFSVFTCHHVWHIAE
ncbi:hypothetical protein N9Y42_01320 [Mariniblastus sp.]|nr:hypothetical protein [Mariniblastus sp.]